MKAREVITKITSQGGELIRQRGSHRFFRIEVNGVVAHTTVSGKDRDDIPAGLLSKIDRDLAPALGKGWTKK
ncbi:type II toxin-antitoxin system HicA family toxin [Microbacterium sp. NIBRBAC000506063]|uniref:type II toxin-antitoxin system HicA family toxin n=1 Tax=Microbacterium sp. NIBRBAC000506063 TaxID=2734618 RepID=UPI001BB7B574|nr:type II toxin-antitoxin system HicA family toxin [Microbacterium sp. NIBRBAC000506063]QTV79498.1 type II toxin-antitoxin system HicA family toxin [Microbacterium sp. NIBRBAC000506063]